MSDEGQKKPSFVEDTIKTAAFVAVLAWIGGFKLVFYLAINIGVIPLSFWMQQIFPLPGGSHFLAQWLTVMLPWGFGIAAQDLVDRDEGKAWPIVTAAVSSLWFVPLAYAYGWQPGLGLLAVALAAGLGFWWAYMEEFEAGMSRIRRAVFGSETAERLEKVMWLGHPPAAAVPGGRPAGGRAVSAAFVVLAIAVAGIGVFKAEKKPVEAVFDPDGYYTPTAELRIGRYKLASIYVESRGQMAHRSSAEARGLARLERTDAKDANASMAECSVWLTRSKAEVTCPNTPVGRLVVDAAFVAMPDTNNYEQIVLDGSLSVGNANFRTPVSFTYFIGH